MNLSRKGETLWQEWTGNGYTESAGITVVFYTEEHVSLNEPVVMRALASALQREGMVDSLSDAYSSLERWCLFSTGHIGLISGEREFSICSDTGETFYGDVVEEVIPATFVEVNLA